MTTKEIQKIDQRDLQVISPFLNETPVRLGHIANALGVQVMLSSLGTGISGQIAREGAHYIIRVNRNESRERQRFTIAHELAHYLLHRDIIDSSPDGITDTVLYRSGTPEYVEFEANRLAAEIVMPSKLVKEDLTNTYKNIVTDNTIEGLASRFGVSKAAMEIKLSQYENV